MNQVTAKQHYVPQFYLRSFADPDGMLNVFSNEHMKILKRRSVSSVCHQRFFYAQKTGKQDDVSQSVEDFFGEAIENPLAKALPDLVERIKNYKQIDWVDKENMAVLMSTMWMRNPAFRNQMNSMQGKMIKDIYRVAGDHLLSDSKIDEYCEAKGIDIDTEEREQLRENIQGEKYNLDFSNQMHLQFMLDYKNLRGFTNLFYGQYWKVYITKTKRKFVTTNNPVAVIAPKKSGVFGATFLERQHYMALSPDIMIETFYPQSDKGIKLKRQTIFEADKWIVDKLNLIVASQSEYIYSSTPNEVEWFAVAVPKLLEAQNIK